MNSQIPPSLDVNEWISKQPANPHIVDISIIVPCYNEERRLPSTLIDMIDYLESRQANYEIIVVDDGSTDGTADLAKKFERIKPQINLIRSPKNYGKGHAVRLGVLSAHGKLILFADADGATPFAELSRLEEAITSGADVAIGSRALSSSNTKIITSIHRRFLGRLFNFVVNLLAVPDITDTQCGFKLFTAQAARFIFERQQSDGFSFDVEILFIAKKAQINIKEIAINWHNIPGSKVNLFTDSLKMLLEVIFLRFKHAAISPQDYKKELLSR